MVSPDTHDVERKTIAILKVLKDSPEPIGAARIAHQLEDQGISLGERQVRHHLQIMDERGFTVRADRRNGRSVTPLGLNELDSAMVGDRVGSAIARIKSLTFQSSFDPETCTGNVPINVSLFHQGDFVRALEIMRDACESRWCAGDLVAVEGEGERLGDVTVPKGKIGLATISNIAVSGVFLRAGIPLDFRFAGTLQVKDGKCTRFIDLIEYAGSSLDPAEMFISSKMTSVTQVAGDGNGRVLACFCEIPTPALTRAEAAFKGLEAAGIRSLLKSGRAGESVCEVFVAQGKTGIILADGLNLVAAVSENDLAVENHAMAGVTDFARLIKLSKLATTV
jgi:repressor of nif and glnA expression